MTRNVFHTAGPLWGDPSVTNGFSTKKPVIHSLNVFFVVSLINCSTNRQVPDHHYCKTPSLPKYINMFFFLFFFHFECYQSDSLQNNKIRKCHHHYSDTIIGAMASQITSLIIVYSTIYPGAVLRKHQSYASLAFVRGIHRWPDGQ